MPANESESQITSPLMKSGSAEKLNEIKTLEAWMGKEVKEAGKRWNLSENIISISWLRTIYFLSTAITFK